MHNHAVPSIYTCTHINKNTTIQLLYMKKSSFALPFRDGIHIHMGVIQVYTSQSESDFVRYIHTHGQSQVRSTNTGHSLCSAHKMLLQIEPSLCPGQLKLLDVVAGEIRVRTFRLQ